MELGVNCSLATNNVLNPFTPFGDGRLLRIENLYAKVAQLGAPTELGDCFDMIIARPARLIHRRDDGIAVGSPADIVVLDASDKTSALAELASARLGIKRGRCRFTRPRAELFSS